MLIRHHGLHVPTHIATALTRLLPRSSKTRPSVANSFRAAFITLLAAPQINAQSPLPPTHPEPPAPAVHRLEGLDTDTNTTYALLTISSKREDALLTAQCTALPNQPQHFELFITFSGAAEPAFREHHKRLITEPVPVYTTLTLDFRGYTQVKPFRREFEVLRTGELRYNPPGMSSHNLEEAAWFLQYLRALPELIVTEPAVPAHTATFATEPLLAQLHKEPLCKVSGL